MSRELVQQTKSREISALPPLGEVAQIVEVCKVLSAAPFYQKMGAGGVLAIWLTARELNLPVMACLNGALYTFDGKVSLSTQLMNMMIVNAGHRADVIELNDKKAHIRFVRNDRQKGQGDTFDYVFDIAMAERAGYLKKDNWKTNPRDMLYSRCLSGGARKFMPDVLMNCYVYGEIPGFDEHLVNVVPEVALQDIGANNSGLEGVKRQIEINPVVTPPDNPLPEFPPLVEVAPGYEDFIVRHGLANQQTAKHIYLKQMAEKSNMPLLKVINFAVSNEKVFLERFEKWADQQIPKSSES